MENVKENTVSLCIIAYNEENVLDHLFGDILAQSFDKKRTEADDYSPASVCLFIYSFSEDKAANADHVRAVLHGDGVVVRHAPGTSLPLNIEHSSVCA